jgi:hypothetical protein
LIRDFHVGVPGGLRSDEQIFDAFKADGYRPARAQGNVALK